MLFVQSRQESICGEAAGPPHAPGAQHPQPGWRAQRCQPTTLMNQPPVRDTSHPAYPAAEPLACISNAALPNLCAATTPLAAGHSP